MKTKKMLKIRLKKKNDDEHTDIKKRRLMKGNIGAVDAWKPGSLN